MRRAKIYKTGTGVTDYWVVEYFGPVEQSWTGHDTWEAARNVAVRWVDFR